MMGSRNPFEIRAAFLQITRREEAAARDVAIPLRSGQRSYRRGAEDRRLVQSQSL